MGSLKVGRGTEEDVDVGPLITDEHACAKVDELVLDAVGGAAQRRWSGDTVGAGWPGALLPAHGACGTSPTTHGC